MHELVCLLSDLQDMTKNGIWEGSRDYLVHAVYNSTTNPISYGGLENLETFERWEIVSEMIHCVYVDVEARCLIMRVLDIRKIRISLFPRVLDIIWA